MTLGEKRRPQSGEKAPRAVKRQARGAQRRPKSVSGAPKIGPNPTKRWPKVDLEVGNGSQSEPESIPRASRELFFETKFKNT